MRPVNLIPPEQRRGGHAPTRTGPIAYLVVGALALALGAVTLVVLTDNKVSNRETKIAQLKQQNAAVSARADQFAPFAQFRTVEQQRTATIRSLTDSRFDWERVMRELSRIIPSDVWLTGLTGTVSADVGVEGGATVDTRGSIQGPALELAGCAVGHKGVAEFLSALRDIDGVTRVGLSDSERPGGDTGSSSSTSTSTSTSTISGSSSGTGSSGCGGRDFISQFQIVAAFDAAPTPAIPGAAPSSSTAVPPATPTSSTAAATPTSAPTG